jgi:hypothetical protein
MYVLSQESRYNPLSLKKKNPQIIWQFFVGLVRESLHIVLAFSPVGEAFRARCRQFPSIINCCAIDWYQPWPADALYSVAERHYLNAPKELVRIFFSFDLAGKINIINGNLSIKCSHSMMEIVLLL